MLTHDCSIRQQNDAFLFAMLFQVCGADLAITNQKAKFQ